MGLSKIKLLCLLVAAAVWVTPLAAQTLADRARELRKEKRTPSANEKVYTNDTMNLRPSPSIADNNAGAKAASKSAESAAAAADAEAGAGAEEDKGAIASAMKDKISKAKDELTALQRELDVGEREYKLQVAQFYADAGNRLRNEKAFADQQRKHEADITDKKKKIVDTQALMESLRNEARRAGIPAGQIP